MALERAVARSFSFMYCLIVKPKILVIVGPTASGKSSLAVKLARKFSAQGGPASGWNGAEIISADSRQVYKGLNLGTGKITKRETRGIPHYMLDVISPKKIYTVADYVKKARQFLTMIYHNHKLPIIVGGSGFYIDALVYNQKFPEVKPNIKLRKKLQKMNVEELFKILKRMDPERAKRIDKHNKVRIIRALEIVESIGKVPTIEHRTWNIEHDKEYLFIGIKPDNKTLRKNIHRRLFARIREGMIEEVKKLHKQGLSWKRMEELGLEYRYIARFLQNKISKVEMLKQLESASWQYSRRQMTWFKRNKNIHWFEPDKVSEKQIISLIKDFNR